MSQVVSFCIASSVYLYQELSEKLGYDYIAGPRNGIAIKIKFINSDIQYATGMCIYCGFDANEKDSNVVVYEMALFNHCGNYKIYNHNFDYSDSRHFKTIDEIVLELARVRALVIKGDHNQIHNYESESDEFV